MKNFKLQKQINDLYQQYFTKREIAFQKNISLKTINQLLTVKHYYSKDEIAKILATQIKQKNIIKDIANINDLSPHTIGFKYNIPLALHSLVTHYLYPNFTIKEISKRMLKSDEIKIKLTHDFILKDELAQINIEAIKKIGLPNNKNIEQIMAYIPHKFLPQKSIIFATIYSQEKRSVLEWQHVIYLLQQDATNLKRYGVKHALQNRKLKEKQEQTMLKRYGATNIFATTNFIQYNKKIQKQKYGGMGIASPFISKKIEQTLLTKYGAKNYFASHQFLNYMTNKASKQYTLETNNRKIVHSISALPSYWTKYKQNFINNNQHDFLNYYILHPLPSNFEQYINNITFGSNQRLNVLKQFYNEYHNDFINYIQRHFIINNLLLLNANDFNGLKFCMPIYSKRAHGNWPIKMLKEQLPNMKYHNVILSTYEQKIFNFLQQLGIKNIVVHNRKIIKPLEVDFYLPQYRIAIEINPTFTHNSDHKQKYMNSCKPPQYHINKYKKCLDQHIKLISLYEHDFVYWGITKDKLTLMLKPVYKKITNLKIHLLNNKSNKDKAKNSIQQYYGIKNINKDYLFVIQDNHNNLLGYCGIQIFEKILYIHLSLCTNYYIDTLLEQLINKLLRYYFNIKRLKNIVLIQPNNTFELQYYLKQSFWKQYSVLEPNLLYVDPLGKDLSICCYNDKTVLPEELTELVKVYDTGNTFWFYYHENKKITKETY